VRVTFSPGKREWTLKHRGLDFADATEIFSDRHTILSDDRIDYGEVRYVSAGYLRGRMVIVVWTPRNDARHVISMRYCHEKEEKRWRAHLGD
jgi:uncharacterized protein